ncbi:putative siderophore transport system permease protein YfhA [Lachnospiraceae bacterium]|nr:putative siderophore transport system permease protein YfhA [Lachnospiraceae bacterium]
MPFMKKNNFLTILLLFLLLIACSCAGIAFGSVSLSPGNVVKVLFSTDSSSTASTLVRTVRSPRVLGGLFAGMGLACAGVILQGVMNNSLASPNTIGINSGSGFGVMLALLLFPQKTGLLPVFAFCGALTAALLVFLLAYLGDSSRTTIVLAGITISSFFNAGINTVKILDTEITVNLTSFMAGSLSGLTMKKLLLPCGCVLLAFCLSLFFARSLNILGLGDDIARSLGMRVFLTRFTLLALASILAGCVVSYAGLLSFVGLVVPHICRHLFGNDARLLLPCSALLGGSFVLMCDLAGRVLFAPFELPAGILMAFIGGPFFLYLLLKKKGGRRVHA